MVVELEDIKEYLKITGTSEDDFLDKCQTRSIGEITNYTQTPLESSADNVTLIFPGNGCDEFMIPKKPVTNLKSLEFRANPLDNFEDVTGGTYVLRDVIKVPMIYNINTFFSSYEYRMIATAGYTSSTLPSDIEEMIIEMVSIKYVESLRKDDMQLAVSAIVRNNMGDSVTYTYKDLWKDRWKPALKRYRVIV